MKCDLIKQVASKKQLMKNWNLLMNTRQNSFNVNTLIFRKLALNSIYLSRRIINHLKTTNYVKFKIIANNSSM